MKKIIIFLILIISIFILGDFFSPYIERIKANLQQIPLTFSALLFVLLYSGGTFFVWHLKDPLKLIGAIIFGTYLSSTLIYLSEIVNAFIFFKLSNFLGQDLLERFLKGRFKNFYRKLEDTNLGWVFLLRAVPLIPYRILDISFGLSGISFKRYLTAVILASFPRIFWIQFILAGVGSFSFEEMILYLQKNYFIFIWSFFYFILAGVVAFKLARAKI